MQTSIAGDFISSAFRERGKAGVSSIEVTWEKTLVILPPDLVPMWGQMEESGDCCGFIQKKSGELKWRVARHGRFQLNKGKMQIKETDLAAHLLSSSTSVNHAQKKKKKGAHAVRPPSSTDNSGTERRREKRKRKGKTFEL